MTSITREVSFGYLWTEEEKSLYRIAAGIPAEDALRHLCAELYKLGDAAETAACAGIDPLMRSIADGLERCTAVVEALLPADWNREET